MLFFLIFINFSKKAKTYLIPLLTINIGIKIYVNHNQTQKNHAAFYFSHVP